MQTSEPNNQKTKGRKRIFLKTIPIFLLILITTSALAEDWYRILSLKGMWKFSIGDRKEWALPEYDDREWEKIYVPSTWEDEGFYNYDGFAWYRTSFDASDIKTEQNIYLFMGYIDDVDQVFFNGNLIGSSGSFPPKYSTAYKAYRRYSVPSAFINFEGENVIAVRVYDAGQAGGIIAGKIGLYINREEEDYDVTLSGIWKFSIRDRQDMKESDYDDSAWKNIMVPAPWERQGFHHYDGFAWYRKTFVLPQELGEEELVLLLGKIDDFDQTYVNGYLVGSTKDYKPYGRSGSHAQLRAYYIPRDILKPGEENVIAVRVEDMGNVGGIYQGPVGLVKQSKFTRFWRYR